MGDLLDKTTQRQKYKIMGEIFAQQTNLQNDWDVKWASLAQLISCSSKEIMHEHKINTVPHRFQSSTITSSLLFHFMHYCFSSWNIIITIITSICPYNFNNYISRNMWLLTHKIIHMLEELHISISLFSSLT